MLDEKATLASCLRMLEEFLPSQIQSSDRLIFYFAGHGIALNGDDGPEGFLIPQDARLGDTRSYLPMVRLQKALNKLPCRHFLTILDCCFAGAFRWSCTRKLLVVPDVIHRQHYDRFIDSPAWQVITSASHDQTASDSLALQDARGITSGNHSPFAAALIEALQGGADSSPPGKDGKPPGDGVTTASELYLYLRDRVEIATEKKGVRQTPGLYPLNKHDRGEYIFFTPGHELNLPPAPPLDESQNPYRGLESFNQEHSELFFGRQALTQKLYKFCQKNPLTVVLGASGTGKSSLVKAGLIPYLQQLEPTTDKQWQILPPMRPGDFPFKELNKILVEHQSSGSSILSRTSLERKKILSGKIEYILTTNPQTKLLLVVDQTEELITLCQDQTERDDFLALLAEWLEKYPQQLRIVLTLRSDFEPQFRAGIRDKRAITQEDYEEIGGVTQSLTQRADSEFGKLVKQDPAFAQTIQYVMLRMIAVGGGELARRRVLLSELKYPEPENVRVKEIIRRFSAARLLVRGQDTEGRPYVEPAHDALVRGWQKLLVWKQEEQESLLLQRRLTPAAEEWKNLEYQKKHFGLRTKTEPLVNWLDATLYSIEKLFFITRDSLLKLVRRMSEQQHRFIGKSEQYLWNTNPYLNVLKEKLDSNNYLFNQIEAEFLKISIRRKRNNRRRLIASVTLVILSLSLLAYFAWL
ncbi:MAG: caspase family protein, partial [Waterburya sp.]